MYVWAGQCEVRRERGLIMATIEVEVEMTTDFATQIDQASRAQDLERALTLALQWTREDDRSSKAWSKLAYVHELGRDFGAAAHSIRRALDLAPDNPAYLFKAGVIDYRGASYHAAAAHFRQCVASSLELEDGYYLDAAKIAQARCLVALGRADLVAEIIDDLPDEAATWLDGRMTAQAVRRMADRAPGVSFG